MNRPDTFRPDTFRFDLAVFSALAAFLLVTRTHSLSHLVHLPDTGRASFFVLGFLVRRPLGFVGLSALAYAIDVTMIRVFGGSGFCFTPAYALLVPAHGAMWLAGRFAAAKLADRPAALPLIVLLVIGATLVSQALSSGGFYFLGGRYPDPTMAGFLSRLVRYTPGVLGSTLLWCAVAGAIWALAISARPRLRRQPAR